MKKEKEKEKRTKTRVRAVDKAIQPHLQGPIFAKAGPCDCGSCDCDHTFVRRSNKVGDVLGVYEVCHPTPKCPK